MSRPNYKQIEKLLEVKAHFDNRHSFKAWWDGDVYFVMSYRTVIAKFHKDINTWYLDSSKYSRTTSKQQSLLLRAITAHDDGYEIAPL